MFKSKGGQGTTNRIFKMLKKRTEKFYWTQYNYLTRSDITKFSSICSFLFMEIQKPV